MVGACRAAAFLISAAIFAAGFAIPTSSAGAVGIRKLSLPVNDIIYDPVSRRIYASAASTADPSLGNTITVIDPWPGSIHASIFVGSEPDPRALSDDSEFLLVGLDGAAKVRRAHIPARPENPGLEGPIAWPRRELNGRR